MLLDSGDNHLLFVEMRFEKVERRQLVADRATNSIGFDTDSRRVKNVKRQRLSDFSLNTWRLFLIELRAI